MKFFSSLAILIATSNVSKGENCPGTDFPSGTVVGKDNQKNFQRRGNNCPCSFVSIVKIIAQTLILSFFLIMQTNINPFFVSFFLSFFLTMHTNTFDLMY